MKKKKKVIYLLPGSRPPLDTTIAYVPMGGTILIGILSFLLTLTLAVGLFNHALPFFPMPPGNNHPVGQLVIEFYEVWLGRLIPHFRGDTYWLYMKWIDWLNSPEVDKLSLLSYRWFMSIASACIASFMLAKISMKPAVNEYQVRGKVLYEEDDAFDVLKPQFDNQMVNTKSPPAFILATRYYFNPMNSNSYKELKPKDVIYMPDAQRRPHSVFVGGSRRGKTNSMTGPLMQFKHENEHGGNVKVLIVDTPKDDYSKWFSVKDRRSKRSGKIRPAEAYLVAPQDLNGVVWDMTKDFITEYHWETFWLQQVPDAPSGQNTHWTSSTRTVCCAASAILANLYPEDYGLNNTVYLIKDIIANPYLYRDKVAKYYPKAIEFLQALEGTGESKDNLATSVNNGIKNITTLAMVWDGYNTKYEIKQMSVRMLLYEENILTLAEALYPMFDLENVVDGKPKTNYHHIVPNIVFRGLVRGLNQTKGAKQWKWRELQEILRQDYKEVMKLAGQNLTEDEKAVICPPEAIPELLELTAGEMRQGHRRSFANDDAADAYCALAFLNRQTHDFIYRALIRKHGLKDPWNAIHAELTAWQKGGMREVFDIVCSKLKGFELATLTSLSHNDHMTLLSGGKPILQRWKEWDRFEGTKRVSFGDWIRDENPDKKYFVFKQSADFPEVTTPLINAALSYMTSVVLGGTYMDDKDMGIVRKFYVMLDEFQTLGNIEKDIKRWLELFASRGISIWLACQDLSQLVSIYKKEFVDFLLGNTGNLFVFGSNQGETSKILSEVVGNKKINKFHRSQSISDGKISFSENWQVHDDIVIHPSEINSKLGLDINGDYRPTMTDKLRTWLKNREPFANKHDLIDQLLGMPDEMKIRMLYLPSNNENAYILHNPLMRFSGAKSRLEPAKWTYQIAKEPPEVDVQAIFDEIYPKPISDAAKEEGDESDQVFDMSHDSTPELTDEELATYANAQELKYENLSQPTPARDADNIFSDEITALLNTEEN